MRKMLQKMKFGIFEVLFNKVELVYPFLWKFI